MQIRVATTADTVRPKSSYLQLAFSLQFRKELKIEIDLFDIHKVTCVPQRCGEYLDGLHPHDEPADIAGCLGRDGEAD